MRGFTASTTPRVITSSKDCASIPFKGGGVPGRPSIASWMIFLTLSCPISLSVGGLPYLALGGRSSETGGGLENWKLGDGFTVGAVEGGGATCGAVFCGTTACLAGGRVPRCPVMVPPFSYSFSEPNSPCL